MSTTLSLQSMMEPSDTAAMQDVETESALPAMQTTLSGIGEKLDGLSEVPLTLVKMQGSINEILDSLRQMQKTAALLPASGRQVPMTGVVLAPSKDEQLRASLMQKSLQSHIAISKDDDPLVANKGSFRGSVLGKRPPSTVRPSQAPPGTAREGDLGTAATVSKALRSPPLIGNGSMLRADPQHGGTGHGLLLPKDRFSTISEGSERQHGTEGAHVHFPAQANFRPVLPGVPSATGMAEESADSSKEENATDNQNSKRSSKTSNLSFQVEDAVSSRKWSLGGLATRAKSHRRFSLASLSSRHANSGQSRDRGSSDTLGESAHQTLEELVMTPDSTLRVFLDLHLMLSLLLIGFWMPIQVTYDQQRTLPENWWLVLILADIALILDVPLSFFTGFVFQDGRFEMNLGAIAKKYASSWLITDLVAAVPLAIAGNAHGTAYTMLRLFKLFKVVKLFFVLSRLQLGSRSPLLSYAKIFLPIIVLFHMMACIWHHVTRQDAKFLNQEANTEKYMLELYVADFYWTVMTMTSVGYGDISPDGSSGRLYAVLIMLCSSVYGGFVVSTTSHTLKGFYDDDMEARVRQAVSFMRERQISRDLQRRVEYSVRKQVHQEKSLAVAPRLLDKLSPPMQRELAYQLLSKDLMQFPVFSSCPSTFISQLAQSQTWTLALTGDLVVEEGQLVQEMIFLVKGVLLMLRAAPDGFDFDDEEDETPDTDFAAVQETMLHPGAWFGERCLFQPPEMRQFTVLADTDAELAVLSADEYHRICQMYPKLWQKHGALCKQISAGTMNLQDLRYRPPKVSMRSSWQSLLGIGS